MANTVSYKELGFVNTREMFKKAMAKAVFDNAAAKQPKNNFTVGINDDVTRTSLDYDTKYDIESHETFRAMFYGLGSDGTVGANKNTMKIISQDTDNFAQGYFVYDSKKAGSMTVSHVRFGKKYIRAPYTISKANFIGCHQFPFLEKYDVLSKAEDGAVFLLNSPYKAGEVWNHLPVEVQEVVIAKKLKFYVIDASHIAVKTGMGPLTLTLFMDTMEIIPTTRKPAVKTAPRSSILARTLILSK